MDEWLCFRGKTYESNEGLVQALYDYHMLDIDGQLANEILQEMAQLVIYAIDNLKLNCTVGTFAKCATLRALDLIDDIRAESQKHEGNDG